MAWHPVAGKQCNHDYCRRVHSRMWFMLFEVTSVGEHFERAVALRRATVWCRLRPKVRVVK